MLDSMLVMSSGGESSISLGEISNVVDNAHWQTFTIDKALDNDDNTWWIASSKSGTVTITLKESVKNTFLNLRTGNYSGSNVTNSIEISISDDGVNYTSYRTINTNYSAGRRLVDIQSNTPYRYIKLVITSSSSNYLASLACIEAISLIE